MRFLISWFAVSLAITAAGVYGKEKCLKKDCKPSDQPPTSYKIVTTPDRASSIKVYKDKFEITLNVQHFDFNVVKINTVNDHLVVETRYKKKQDGRGSKEWVRIYRLPVGSKPVKYESALSPNGLTITVPRPEGKATGERDVPLMLSGPTGMEPIESPHSSKAKPKKKQYVFLIDERSEDSVLQIYEKCCLLSFAGLPC